ncbi:MULTISPECIES: hypothetical protein [unclassified Adlercreutzia]|uniref:hypothetical protein n=1 Tax=unclassified Adlercreutzia TaxID=2636013 RepID=UPI0013EA4F3F|nr:MULTISPECIES: hypothetical protein [unclassified Adlercreutzia]
MSEKKPWAFELEGVFRRVSLPKVQTKSPKVQILHFGLHFGGACRAEGVAMGL